MAEERSKYSQPFPVRLTDACEQKLTELAEKTGMTKSELIRRACAWAIPKFSTGEIPVIHPEGDPA